jgi:hypothetical protein
MSQVLGKRNFSNAFVVTNESFKNDLNKNDKMCDDIEYKLKSINNKLSMIENELFQIGKQNNFINIIPENIYKK